MSGLTDWLRQELSRLDAEGLRRDRRVVQPLPGGWCQLSGRRLLNFASNDYLALAHDQRLCAAAAEALQCGVGSRASALVCGRSAWHERLERKLAEFENQPAAILFPSGYAANLGTISALVQPDDVVFCDRLNHASLVDGCRMTGATLRVYRHTRLDKLERELRKAGGRRRWIVTDGVFSMDGDLAPLPDLCDLSERYDASLIVDEAHATGVFGKTGRGVAEHFGVEDRVAVRIGTLSKAVGCLGGFVAGPAELIEWLWNRARTQIYSTALPPAVCAAACRALEIIQSEPERRERLLAITRRLRQGLIESNIDTPRSAEAPIVPVLLNTPERAMQVARELERQGFLVAAIRPPTVPYGTSRLRISLTAAQTAEDVDRLLEAVVSLVRG